MRKEKHARIMPTFASICLPLMVALLLTACGSGSGGGGDTVSGTTLAAPKDVTASPSDAQVIVNWPSVSGTTYNLYMASQNGITKGNYGSLTGGMKHSKVTAPFVHTGLANGTTYYFVVTAENTSGESVESNEVSATPLAGKISLHPGSMATARNGHTATLLLNGKALIIGGTDSNGNILRNAELYDPATGAFTDIGNMTTWRDEHAATLLSNGKVLIAGGNDDASMEIYDSATGTFTDIGKMSTVRYEHTATLLPNGKVLIAGGYDDNFIALSNAELYDLATDKFTPTSRMAPARYGHTATLLSNGKVMIAGGADTNDNVLSSAEIYDPATGTFTAAGKMTTAREGHTAALLSNGKVLITGGWDGSKNNILSSAELFDPAAGTFTAIGGMTTARYAHTATPLSDGKEVLILGGYNNESAAFSSAEQYTPATGTFSAINSMISVSISPESASVATGGSQTFSATVTGSTNTKVIWSVQEGASGGTITSGGVYTASLTPGTYHIVATSQADPNKSAMAAIDVISVSVSISPVSASILTGGNQTFSAVVTGSTDTKVTWSVQEGAYGGTITSGGVYTAPSKSGTYHIVATSQFAPNKSATATVDVLLVSVSISPTSASVARGGSQTFSATVTGSTNTKVTWNVKEGAYGGAITSGGVYTAPSTSGTYHIVATSQADPNNSATATIYVSSMATARSGHTATWLTNGKVLIAGGARGSSSGSNYYELSSAELCDSVTGNFTATGSMATAHSEHTATLLTNGKVLIAGGRDSTGYLSNAELYDPVTGNFTATGSKATARIGGHTATLLTNGKVLIAGGRGSSGSNYYELSSAELYDPVTGNFTATGSMATARSGHTATLLTNGKILIAGGRDTASSVSSAELYDPVTGNFTATGSMATARSGHTATLLPNGKVLIVGGRDSNYYELSSAELYDPVTGNFTAAGSMATARLYHTATLLPNGKVLIAGGRDSNYYELSSAEMYDPNTGTF